MATAKKEVKADKPKAVKAPAVKVPKAPPAPKVTYPLHEAVALVVKKHESQAEAARQFGIGKAYLSRLLSGVKDQPSEETLEKLGLRRLPSEYTILRKPAGQQA